MTFWLFALIALTVESPWNDLSPGVLKNYQVVLWLDDAPALPAQRAAFQHFMEQGGGWLGFHIAGYMDSRSTWPWFADFLGTVFYGNIWPPLPAMLIIDDRTHPVMKGSPQVMFHLPTSGTSGNRTRAGTPASKC